MRWIVSAPRAVAAALVFSMLLAPALRAQGVTTGAITGKVTDASGQPVVLADVRIVNRSTGYTTSTRTRENGLFLVQGLEVGGPYTITVRAIGHQPYQRDNIDVKLSEATRVDIKLAPQAVELAAVTVTSGATADFSPTRQGVGTQISDSLVRRIPTFSRDFVDQLKLSPQVVFPATGAASGAGAYNRYNTITIDGANQSERFNLSATNGVPGGGSRGKIVSLDAVKEFRVLFTPSDVRQGNFAGMLVNAVTKSGTNEFHGGASYTYRSNTDVLGLKLVGQDLRASPLDVKQYSFYIGGPIIRDRLHFFIAPEFQEKTQPALGPYYLSGQGSPAPNTPSVPLDSLTRIANIMQSTYNFNVGTTAPVNLDNPLRNLFGRIDFQISPVHRLVVREIINHDENGSFSRNLSNYNNSPLNQNSGFRFGSNQFTAVTKNSSTTGQLYSNFAGGLSNELIVGYSTINDERQVPVQAPEVGVGVNVGGIKRAVTFGTEQFSPGNLLDQKIFEIVNNLTIPKGAHVFTVGGRLDFTHIFNNFAQGSYGVYTFPTIDSLAAGTPSGYAVGYANSQNAKDIPADFHVRVYSLYGQDQWAVNHHGRLARRHPHPAGSSVAERHLDGRPGGRRLAWCANGRRPEDAGAVLAALWLQLRPHGRPAQPDPGHPGHLHRAAALHPARERLREHRARARSIELHRCGHAGVHPGRKRLAESLRRTARAGGGAGRHGGRQSHRPELQVPAVPRPLGRVRPAAAVWVRADGRGHLPQGDQRSADP